MWLPRSSGVGAGGFGMPETQTCSPQNSVGWVQSNSELPPVNPPLNSQSLEHGLAVFDGRNGKEGLLVFLQ